MATTLTGYGGVEEIGGNAFLLDDGRSSIFLDFGRRFGNDPHDLMGTGGMKPGIGDYFDEYLQPRTFSMARDLAALRLIPDVPHAYRPDIGGDDGPAGVDAVLLSHAHADHAGLIPLLKPDVSVLSSVESWATLESLEATGSGVMNQYTHLRAAGLARTSTGKISSHAHYDDGPVRSVDFADKQDIGDWDITHHPVDHSIHGARGSILAGRDITVAYTGDFRLHGRSGDATKRFLDEAAGADILITEGTNVSQSHKHGGGTDDEVHVEGEIQDAIHQSGDGFVGIAFPPRDLDRFHSIWNVARAEGRRLVISTKQADMLERMRAAGQTDLPDPCTDRSVAIHLRTRRKGVLRNPRGQVRVFAEDLGFEDLGLDVEEWDALLRSEYSTWERRYLDTDNMVTSADIGADPSGFLLSINFWTMTELFDVFPQPPGSRPGGLYIHSMTQPFNDEMEISDRRLGRWLSAFGLRRVDTHVSGHLSEEDLHWAIDEVGAKHIVPVHSMHPELTAEKYEARTGQKAYMPVWGKAMDLA